MIPTVKHRITIIPTLFCMQEQMFSTILTLITLSVGRLEMLSNIKKVVSLSTQPTSFV